MNSPLEKLSPGLINLMTDIIADIKETSVKIAAERIMPSPYSQQLIADRQWFINKQVSQLNQCMELAELSPEACQIIWNSLVEYLRVTHPFRLAA